jgi:predicted PurR-regulated permease PerM
MRGAQSAAPAPSGDMPQIPDWTPAEGAGRLELALHRLSVVIKAKGDASAELEPVQQAIESAVVSLAKANPELAFAMTDMPDDEEHEVQHRLPKAAPGFLYLDKKTVKNLHGLFDGVDLDGSGDLNQTETTSLLKKLGMFTTEEEAHKIYMDMDVDHSGDVDFSEFAIKIDHELSSEKYTDNERIQLMKGFALVKTGFAGTTWRPQANVIWMMNAGVMIMTVSVIIVGIIYFTFILIPLTMAYFFTYVLGPIFDLFYQRPLLCCGEARCYKRPPPDAVTLQQQHDYAASHGTFCNVKKDGITYDGNETPLGCPYFAPLQRTIMDIFLLGRVPETLALLLTLIISFGSFALLAYAIFLQIYAMMYICEDGGSCGSRCEGDPYSGHECISTDFVNQMDNKTAEVRQFLLEEYYIIIEDLEPSNASIINPTRMSLSELTTTYGGVGTFLNDFTLILLLCIYMLSTRTMRTVDDHDLETNEPHNMTLSQKIEAQIRHYVILKTKLSALTALLVTLALLACGVKLWLVWGVLAFVLNFIPTVGSLIAMLLPLPVIIVDESLSITTKLLAFFLPALVQGYVGNVLEPAMFGKSLNLTALSVLCALVLWSAIWGLSGAILSVPLLGVTKLLLAEADYPLAKQALNVIREDNSIEESLEISRGGEFTLLPPDPVAEKAQKEREKQEKDMEIQQGKRPHIEDILATAHHSSDDEDEDVQQAQVVGAYDDAGWTGQQQQQYDDQAWNAQEMPPQHQQPPPQQQQQQQQQYQQPPGRQQSAMGTQRGGFQVRCCGFLVPHCHIVTVGDLPVALALVLSRCAYCTDALWLLCVPCAWFCREADSHAVGRQGRMGLNTVYSADAHNVTVIGKIQFASKMRQVVFRSDNTPPL